MDPLLACIEIGPAVPHYSVIWLHGLGADGHDFEPIVGELDFPTRDGVRFVFPHAPQRPVTINGGYVMRAWYDIRSPQINAEEDTDGIITSARQLEALVENEIQRGIPAEHIVLAGFSQGGAIALHTGLRYAQPLAGILALSTYLPLATYFEAERHAANQRTPVFMAHGRQDPIVPFELGERTRELLARNDYEVEWHAYNMEHSVVPQEINEIAAWFGKTLT
jgi:phospholipase/carboxylesterase